MAQTYVTLTCAMCGKEFQRTLKRHNDSLRRGISTFRCSKTCCGYGGNFAIREIVLKGLRAGMTPYRIALKYRLSRTTVYSWKKKLEIEGFTAVNTYTELVRSEVGSADPFE